MSTNEISQQQASEIFQKIADVYSKACKQTQSTAFYDRYVFDVSAYRSLAVDISNMSNSAYRAWLREDAEYDPSKTNTAFVQEAQDFLWRGVDSFMREAVNAPTSQPIVTPTNQPYQSSYQTPVDYTSRSSKQAKGFEYAEAIVVWVVKSAFAIVWWLVKSSFLVIATIVVSFLESLYNLITRRDVWVARREEARRAWEDSAMHFQDELYELLHTAHETERKLSRTGYAKDADQHRRMASMYLEMATEVKRCNLEELGDWYRNSNSKDSRKTNGNIVAMLEKKQKIRLPDFDDYDDRYPARA